MAEEFLLTHNLKNIFCGTLFSFGKKKTSCHTENTCKQGSGDIEQSGEMMTLREKTECLVRKSGESRETATETGDEKKTERGH